MFLWLTSLFTPSVLQHNPSSLRSIHSDVCLRIREFKSGLKHLLQHVSKYSKDSPGWAWVFLPVQVCFQFWSPDPRPAETHNLCLFFYVRNIQEWEKFSGGRKDKSSLSDWPPGCGVSAACSRASQQKIHLTCHLLPVSKGFDQQTESASDCSSDGSFPFSKNEEILTRGFFVKPLLVTVHFLFVSLFIEVNKNDCL